MVLLLPILSTCCLRLLPVLAACVGDGIVATNSIYLLPALAACTYSLCRGWLYCYRFYLLAACTCSLRRGWLYRSLPILFYLIATNLSNSRACCATSLPAHALGSLVPLPAALLVAGPHDPLQMRCMTRIPNADRKASGSGRTICTSSGELGRSCDAVSRCNTHRLYQDPSTSNRLARVPRASRKFRTYAGWGCG
jgi:hypothetical protein